MRGCDVVVRCLENLGVDTIFAYPGGASMELHQALTRTKKIRTILPRHEQGGAFMAQGYSRATGKPGVCMATSGPGATNLVTAIADAHMDSIPLICITGQVYQQFIGRAAFQETDFYGMTLPIVKHSFLVLDYNDLPSIMYKAFKIATTGRPGPVVIDIPKDIQQVEFVPVFPKSIDDVSIPGLQVPPHASDDELNQVLRLIEKSKHCTLLVGRHDQWHLLATMINLGLVVQEDGIVGRQDRATRIAEYGGGALIHENLHDHLSSGHHRARLRMAPGNGLGSSGLRHR